MQWFKHDNNFRHTPKMLYIQRELGDSGFARAIRLLEVMTDRSKSGKNFAPELIVSPPQDETWLAAELRCELSDLRKTLDVFQDAQLIEREPSDESHTAYYLRMPDLADMKDDWSRRNKPERQSTGATVVQSGNGFRTPN